jgi:hypothetical protein
LATVFKEKVGSISPGSAGFAVDGARATWPYYCGYLDMPDAFIELLGTTEYDKSDGRLKRKLPKAHPQYPWLYAERVSNVQGVGKPVTFNITETYEVPLIVQKIAVYRTYLLTVEFLPRPYAVIGDINIPAVEKVWTDPDGEAQTYLSTMEHARFVDVDEDPDSDTVTAQHGMMKFRGGAANGRSYTGMPRMTVPKSLIRMRWFGVPLRYIRSANSHLARFRNCINQFDFWDWERGSLLYKGFKILRRYPQLVPEVNPVFGTNAFTPDKLCDIEIHLEHTTREIAAEVVPANDNWIARGHNLMPSYVDRKFYYVTTSPLGPATPDDPAEWFPLYLSFPLDILFTDPDI